MLLPVEMAGNEPASESGIADASTVCSFSLAEPLRLANFFVVTNFYSVYVGDYVFFIKILDSSNFI